MRATYTIGTLAALTGLSHHTIRAWERRYSALTPDRSETNRRLYADEDVHRLSLLKQAVASGHTIGQVAHLPTEQLQALDLSQPRKQRSHSKPAHTKPDNEKASGERLSSEATAPRFLGASLEALEQLNADSLEEALVRGTAALGILGLLDGVVIPLLGEIENRWSNGSLRVSQEHMATAVLRTYLDGVRKSMPSAPGARRLLLTTPRNQHHEIGLMMAALVAATELWHVTYLGPNLPAKEIADAARVSAVQAVGLSLVHPANDPNMADELRLLRHELGPQMPIIVGGRAAFSYSAVLQEIGAQVCPDLWTFRTALALISPANHPSTDDM